MIITLGSVFSLNRGGMLEVIYSGRLEFTSDILTFFMWSWVFRVLIWNGNSRY